MLKIVSVNGTGRLTTLRLAGRLIGPWVEELRLACEAALAKGEVLALDMSEVSFVDQAGVELLRRLRRRDARLSNCSGFIAELLKG
jgi:ABC-type transporter Mla MlaB component